MTNDEKRFAELSWKLIEAKILYYSCPAELINCGLEISDAEYDKMEHEYLSLCVKLNRPNTISHDNYSLYPGLEAGMMEVDWNRPSVSCALKRLYIKAGIPEEQHRDFGTWYVKPKKKKKKN